MLKYGHKGTKSASALTAESRSLPFSLNSDPKVSDPGDGPPAVHAEVRPTGIAAIKEASGEGYPDHTLQNRRRAHSSSGLRAELHPPQQVPEARVGTQDVNLRLHLNVYHPRVSLLNGRIEPLKGALFVAKPRGIGSAI